MILKHKLRAARRAYIQASAAMEKLDGADFKNAYRIALRAQKAFKQAQEDLEQHVASHGCVGSERNPKDQHEQ